MSLLRIFAVMLVAFCFMSVGCSGDADMPAGDTTGVEKGEPEANDDTVDEGAPAEQPDDADEDAAPADDAAPAAEEAAPAAEKKDGE